MISVSSEIEEMKLKNQGKKLLVVFNKMDKLEDDRQPRYGLLPGRSGLKSSHPFAFLLAALVFIVDGSLGILKISFKRFLHISILKNTLTPLHDHVRKRLGWSDEQVVARWLILQAVASAWLLLLVR